MLKFRFGLRTRFANFLVIAIAVCSAVIIALSAYSDSREDYYLSSREQVNILTNSWNHLERYSASLLISPVKPELFGQWRYSIKVFDERLSLFINSPIAKRLTETNRLFARKSSQLEVLWSDVKRRLSNGTNKLSEYIDVDNSQTGLLWQLGRDSVAANIDQSAHQQLSQLVGDSIAVLTDSRLQCSVLLEELNDIISDHIFEQTADIRFAVFVLSVIIAAAMVLYVMEVQRVDKLYRGHLETELSSKSNEVETQKAKAEAAKLKTEQINNQLQVTVSRANLMSQRAIEATNAKNEFIASISHEIRTPMNAIIGFSEMLAEDNLTDEQKKNVHIIRDSSKHLLGLMNDILDYSKLEAGKLTVDLTNCSVESLLASVESLMRPAAIESGLDFSIIKSPDMPLQLRTDPSRLKQCLINLVSNAIKFTQQGYVNIKISSCHSGSRDCIRFDVADSGMGIASDKLSVIFEPFSQTDTGILPVYGGSGLGLAITKNLVEMLGGNITVDSTNTKGSVFSIILPVGVVDTEPSASESEEDLVPNTAIVDTQFSGTVLVAEDSPTNQTLINLLLKRLGLDVEIVENGKLAVERLQSGKKFDAVLMDIQMPVLNGYEATRQLRKDGFTLPIIALTACAMKGDDKKCFAAGCSDYLSKPIDRKKLTATLAKYFDSTNSAGNTVASKNKPVEILQGDNKMLHEDSNVFFSRSGAEELDFSVMLERIGDEALIDEIVPVFIKDNSQRVESLGKSVETRDFNEIKFYAHSIKGATATVGAVGISELCRQLEAAARDNNCELAASLYEQINSRFNNLIQFLSTSDWKQQVKK